MEQIANAAEISKSMIFHYFKSKLGLFELLVKMAWERTYETYKDYIEDLETLDYIQQFESISRIKLISFKKEIEMYEFLLMLYQYPEDTKISKIVEKYYLKLVNFQSEVLGKIFTQDNNVYFKENIDISFAKKYIQWIIEGYSNELTQKLKLTNFEDRDFDEEWAEYDKIILDLKKMFYKEEYQ